ncbi:MAG: ABC transporter permease subunit [Hyphomicrobiales bacterium]|nr:ABC transporter permease subunit [Hyphomicrobiales bacterium]
MTAASDVRDTAEPLTRRAWVGWIPRGLILGLFAFAIFGPLANMLLWSVAEVWYFPYKLPLEWGFGFWERVFKPRGNAMLSLSNSVVIALFTVVASLAVAIPAGYALARGRLPWRGLILVAFLVPQAFPAVAVHINIARIFYGYGLTGTFAGVILVHTVQGLVFAVWISTAAFAAVDRELEEAARNIGASPLRTFLTVTLPLALPGIMASAVFVFLISLDEFTGTFFVGVPDVVTMPLLLFNASMEGNYQIASITSLILLVPSVLFMLLIERFLKADVLAKVGS